MSENRCQPAIEVQFRLARRPIPWDGALRRAARLTLRPALLWLVVVLLRRTGSSLAPFAFGLRYGAFH